MELNFWVLAPTTMYAGFFLCVLMLYCWAYLTLSREESEPSSSYTTGFPLTFLVYTLDSMYNIVFFVPHFPKLQCTIFPHFSTLFSTLQCTALFPTMYTFTSIFSTLQCNALHSSIHIALERKCKKNAPKIKLNKIFWKTLAHMGVDYRNRL